MNCNIYKRLYPRFSKLPLARKIWDTPEHDEWMSHFHECGKCSDWSLARRVRKLGHDPKRHPCVHIAYRVTQTCKDHGKRCPDIVIHYLSKFDEYFIADYIIHHCPWCGKKLPNSKRDLWFDTLKKMGITDIDKQRIPKRFESDAWFSRDAN